MPDTLCLRLSRHGNEELGNVMGNPGVFQGNPHLYPPKPVPMDAGTGAGFHKPTGKLLIYILYILLYCYGLITE
jgi:hypothetical protein